MKTALVFALLGACVALSYACYDGYDYECVKDDYKKCTAVKVCEDAKKEKCGYDYCDYGYVCASKKKAVCKDFIALKEKCEKKKVCKEIKKPCGYDYCGYDEECVKEKVCKVKHGYGRRLMGKASAHASASASAGGHGRRDYGFKKYGKKYYDSCDYCKKKEKLECYDAYSCVKKEPCKEVIVKKCVKEVLRPGYDVCHGGYEFNWYGAYSYGEKCGDEYCGAGYKCADVYYQKCAAEKCGYEYCDYGYECVADYDDCKKYAYLETVCKDVYEPTCVALGYYAKEYYYPKCKTVYKCDEEENICGGEYCGYGYKCALKECGYYGEDPYHADPYYGDDHKDGYGDDHKDPYYGDDHKDPYYGDDHKDGYGDYHKDGYGDDHKDGYGDDHKDGYGDDYYKEHYGKDYKKGHGKGKKEKGYKEKKPKGGSASSTASASSGPGYAYTTGTAETTGNAAATTDAAADTEGAYSTLYGSAQSDEHGAETHAEGNVYSDDHSHADATLYTDANSDHP